MTTETENKDSSFNEEELADIMSEIESLESEFDYTELVAETNHDEENSESSALESTSEISQETIPASSLDDEATSEVSLKEDELAQAISTSTDGTETSEELKVNSLSIKKNDLQDDIDNEVKVAMLASAPEEKIETSVDKVQESTNVVSIKSAERVAKKEDIMNDIKSVSSEDTKMSLQASGNMNLKLEFEVGGNKVSLYVDESEGLVIQMLGGAKFVIPINQLSEQKKVA